MSDLLERIRLAQRDAGERVVMEDLKAKGLNLYDWSVEKLKETPGDEQIGAGVPLEELCSDLKPHEWKSEREEYGADRDGNRGVWFTVNRCSKCGEER